MQLPQTHLVALVFATAALCMTTNRYGGPVQAAENTPAIDGSKAEETMSGTTTSLLSPKYTPSSSLSSGDPSLNSTFADGGIKEGHAGGHGHHGHGRGRGKCSGASHANPHIAAFFVSVGCLCIIMTGIM
ncbi:hypothetical protein ANO14919_142010 [Xylariales sp. No.14919]|nr:hypothetical protein ANO14919_142010 [Xylariales sp. No.14919]